MARKHTVDGVLRALRLKNDVIVNGFEIMILSDFVYKNNGQKIENPKKKHDLGNGSWGKIDFLVNHYGYSIFHISEF